MLLTYLEVIVGLIIIVYGIMSYIGSSLLASVPILSRKGDVIWLAGTVLIGIAALMAWVGYMFAVDLRLWRIIIAVAGLVLLVLAWVMRPNR
jgi:hypothetical protein